MSTNEEQIKKGKYLAPSNRSLFKECIKQDIKIIFVDQYKIAFQYS